MKLKFGENLNNQYVIGYWPAGNEEWTFISGIISSKEEFEDTLLELITYWDLNEEQYEDICIFKLIDTPNITMIEKEKTVKEYKIKIK